MYCKPKHRDAHRSTPGYRSETGSILPAGLRYTGQALGTTAYALSLPTALSPFMPERWRALRFLLCGALMAHAKSRPPALQFEPPPGVGQQRIATVLALFPFLPAFALNAWLANRPRCAAQGHAFKTFVESACRNLLQRLPRAVAAVLQTYPRRAAGGVICAQLAGSATGAQASMAYLRTQGMQLRDSPAEARVAGDVSPACLLRGVLPFLVPALIDSPLGRGVLQRLHVGPVGAALILTTGVVSAAAAVPQATYARPAPGLPYV